MPQKSEKTISVIIPVYNEEKIVEQSIIQTYEALDRDFNDFEIILIDDGSRDNSLLIMKEIVNKYTNIHLHLNHINLNQGVSIQRGFALSKNEYVLHNGIDLPLNPVVIRELIDLMDDNDLFVLQRNIYSGATLWRRMVSKANIILRKMLFPRLSSGITDMNFVQIYRSRIIKMVLPLAKSPAFTTPEMIFRARFFGLKVATHYVNFLARNEGNGSLGKLHDILWSTYDMIRFRFLLWMGLKKHGETK
ncbi:MAG: putative glycosyltransferase [Bacteroidota bacterium]|nr:putative glycosyltransferase [Bacteroidota bacterium]